MTQRQFEQFDQEAAPARAAGEARAAKEYVPGPRHLMEYVPGRQVTIAHVVANPDRELCEKVGVDKEDAVGILTVTPGEATIIAGDLALKAADVRIGFLDRFSGTLVLCGGLTGVEMAVRAANDGLEAILGFFPARVTRS